MKKVNYLLILLIISISVKAQVTESEKQLKEEVKVDSVKNWKKGGVFSFGLSQTSFTNWAGGGQNSLAGNALFSAFYNYKSPNSAWDNQLDMGYGLLSQGSDKSFIKTDDKIDFTSKYGYKASKNMYFAALVNFKTQMTTGFKNPDDSIKISDFLAPAYILAAMGIDYKPNEILTAFFAPITQKTTLVNSPYLSDIGAYGVEPAYIDDNGNFVSGKRSRTEFGGYIRIFYKNQFFDNISLQSKLDLFSNYLNNPENVDVNWETLIAFKITKYFSTNISTQLLYDDDVIVNIDKNEDGIIEESGPRIQFKEVLTIGFSYKF